MRVTIPALLAALIAGCGGATPAAPPPAPPPPTDEAPVPPPEPVAGAAAEPVYQQSQIGPPRALAVSADGRHLAALDSGGSVAWIEVATGAVRLEDQPFVMGRQDGGTLVLDRAGRRLLAFATSAVPRPRIVLYDLATGAHTQGPVDAGERAASLHPDGERVAWVHGVDAEEVLRIAPVSDLSAGVTAALSAEGRPARMAHELQHTTDGRRLVLSGESFVELRDATTGAVMGRADAPDGVSFALASLTPDGAHVVVVQTDGGLQWLATADGRRVHGSAWPEDRPSMDPYGARLSRDRTRLVTRDAQDAVVVVDTRTGEPVARRTADEVGSGTAELSPDGAQLLVVDYQPDAPLSRWSLASGEALPDIEVGDRMARVIALDDRRLIVFGYEGFRVVDLAEGAAGELRPRAARSFSVWRPVWREDGLGIGLLGRRESAWVSADGEWKTDECLSTSVFVGWPAGASPEVGRRCRAYRMRMEASEVPQRHLASSARLGLALVARGRRVLLLDQPGSRERVELVRPPRGLTTCARGCDLELEQSLDGERLTVIRREGRRQSLWVFDLETGREVGSVAIGTDDELHLSPNHRSVLVGQWDRFAAHVLDGRRGRQPFATMSAESPQDPIDEWGMHAREDVAWARTTGDQLVVLDLTTGERALSRDLDGREFRFTPDGDRVVLLDGERARLLDWRRDEVVLDGELLAEESLGPDGRWASACVEGRLRMRPIAGGAPRTVGPCRFDGPAVLSPDERFVAVAESPWVRVHRMDGRGWLLLRVTEGAEGRAFLALSHDGELQVQGDLAGAVRYRREGPLAEAELVDVAASGRARDDLLARFLAR